MTDPSSPFRTKKGEASYVVAYGKSMSLWPVPCEPIDVTGSYGRTHLNVSGPPDAPPLFLVHGSFCSSALWSPKPGCKTRRDQSRTPSTTLDHSSRIKLSCLNLFR